VTVSAPLVRAQSERGGVLPPAAQGIPPGGPAASPAEIQRLFDAYVVMQAQQQLRLSDEQFAKFVTHLRVLHEVRQRGRMQRSRLLQELRRLSQSGDEDRLRTTLKALTDLEIRTATEANQALAELDAVLDVRQQARFRLLEEQVERRKMDLLTRARQNRRDQF
jgi:hypothetical protein